MYYLEFNLVFLRIASKDKYMKDIWKSYLIFFLITLISGNTQGQEYKSEFKSLPPYINIPTDVQQIYQDREGFIWFATGNEECRFDGYE